MGKKRLTLSQALVLNDLIYKALKARIQKALEAEAKYHMIGNEGEK